jgi:SP family myo-inositol transporter-like MFS transporter 13
MVIGLILAAVGFSWMPVGPPKAPERVLAREAGTESVNTSAAATILVSIMVYVAAYAIGLGNVPWMQSELFPLSVRSLGSGIATATNWGANFIIGLTFLLLMDTLTPSWTFVLYAGICGIGYGLIWAIYPEMSGVSLEQNAHES